MPRYTFTCKECRRSFEVVRSMKDADKFCGCGYCDKPMSRDITADVPFVSGGEYHKAIHSDSLAISPTQRAEHERMFPNIKLDSECRPVFDNFTDHDAYLEKCGFKKERQKCRRKGKRIA